MKKTMTTATATMTTMSDLIWRPEPERLHRARHITCEVPELLVEILEHDYYRNPEGSEDALEVRYYHVDARHYHSSGYPMKGAAWAHLQKYPPVIEVEHGGETEFFRPWFEPKFNPYRKCHTSWYWGWRVLKWEVIPRDEVRR
jgi:hypothetical protein